MFVPRFLAFGCRSSELPVLTHVAQKSIPRMDVIFAADPPTSGYLTWRGPFGF